MVTHHPTPPTGQSYLDLLKFWQNLMLASASQPPPLPPARANGLERTVCRCVRVCPWLRPPPRGSCCRRTRGCRPPCRSRLRSPPGCRSGSRSLPSPTCRVLPPTPSTPPERTPHLKQHESELVIFFFKVLEDLGAFSGATDTLFWTSGDVCLGFQSQGGSLFCMLSCLCDCQIHLWCDTCWLCWGQHGCWVFLIHVLADMSNKHWWRFGLGLEPMTICAAGTTVLYTTRPLRLR